MTNLNVKIPMPEKLRTVEKTLRVLKQDKLADEFVTTMNHAAEQAVPEAAGVFGDAIKGMSIEDAKAILTGTNNAATQYFRRTTETNLYAKFLPIVKQATDQTGVTSAYKQLMEKAEAANSFGSFGRSLLGAESMDVDAYVTNKALDGLFKMVAEEEKRIRENPAARTTALLQKVFGAVDQVVRCEDAVPAAQHWVRVKARQGGSLGIGLWAAACLVWLAGCASPRPAGSPAASLAARLRGAEPYG